MKKPILIAVLIFLVWMACVVGLGFGLHFAGTRLALFCILLGLLGAAALAIGVWYIAKTHGGTPRPGADSGNLHGLLAEASRKLRSSRVAARSLASLPVLYVLGETGSGKTETVLQSGLDAELLDGNIYRDGAVVPTELANLWLAGSWVIVEPGAAVQRDAALWRQLIKATQSASFRSLFSRASRQPMRAALLCVALQPSPSPAEQARTAARDANERLRQLSRTLGASLPVYVLFTRLDSLPHFADYSAPLSLEEARLPLGELLDPVEGGTGLYTERASALLGACVDRIVFYLSRFRLEALARGGELPRIASAYEFPRDLQKQRNRIVDYLVEATRPSQLGTNAFLRGCFFSGVRRVTGERSAPAQQVRTAQAVDAGATSIFHYSSLSTPSAPQPVFQGSMREEPQWVFLPHLFSKLILNDTPALEASRPSAHTSLLKRVLLGTACCCLLAYLTLLTVSFYNNRKLEQEVAQAAAVPVTPPSPGQFASVNDLHGLDRLGSLMLLLNGYHRNGPPLLDRLGLYSGDALLPVACNAYASRFHALLLLPAQTNMLAQLRGVTSPPPPNAEYNTTYRPLKAYLITTSNPEKSSSDFLPPVLTAVWAGSAVPPSELSALAQKQFQTYANLLPDPQSCLAKAGGQPNTAVRDHAREYLSHFGAFPHVYQTILADAAHRFPSVRFNDTFPGSARYIVDSYEVHGAFTKNGFAFMQNAILHPDFSGEDWVLGPAASSTVDPATLSSMLRKQYIADYLAAWRGYMAAARFTGFHDFKEAAAKLKELDSNVSPILQFFSLVSTNTAVDQPEISAAFQAPQAIVPPGAPNNRLLATANQPYIQGLQGLEQAVNSFNQNPNSATDPNAAAPILQAAGAADQAAEALRNGFPPDPAGKVDAISFARLEDPIITATALAHSSVDPTGGGPQTFCAMAGPVLAKFPFSPQANAEASPEEVAQIFSPGQGSLAELHRKMTQFVSFQGGHYVPAPGVNVTPAFLTFLNAADRVSNMLFSAGGTQPTLTFSLHQLKAAGEPDATLNIDGQQLTAGQTATFHWTAQPSSHLTIAAGDESRPLNGTWSVFHLALDGNHPAPNTFDVTFGVNRRITQTVRFEAGGPGAPMLDPHFMNQLHCVSKAIKQ